MTEYETLAERARRYEKKESEPAATFQLIPQAGITHKLFPPETRHNAMWDFAVLEDGRVFFPLCGELIEALTVRLYEYLSDTNEFKLHFRLEDRVIQHDREIRTSKIHTSITQINDGRLIMTTHTTARSPLHPQWMPEAYYTHPWEGFPGSLILIYDPATGALENRGVPVPRESIYGAAYDKKHNALYFQGYLRGHLYCFELDTNEVVDLGKVSEYGSYRLHVGPDGHIYSNSRSGEFFRVNVDTRKIEHAAVFPADWGDYSLGYRQLNYAANGPDGKIYLGVYFSRQLLRYDPATGTLEQLGSFCADDYHSWGTETMNGMTFDDDGVLWYGVQVNTAPIDAHGTRLCKWDVLRGGEPVDFGLLGSVETGRAVSILTELHFHGGKLYLSDSNHGYDAPGVMVIDLAQMEAKFSMEGRGPVSPDSFNYNQAKSDPDIFPGERYYERVQPYLQQWLDADERGRFFAENHTELLAKRIDMVRIWREIGIEESPVDNLRWLDSDTLSVECGSEARRLRLTVRDGMLAETEEIADFTPREAVPEELLNLTYPSVPGRQYLAVPTASCPWNGGRTLVGTKDGMLALVRGSKVFSLGLCAPCGPVKMLTTDSARIVAYGIAGDEMDLGIVFRYDDESGLQWLGRIYFNAFREPGIMASNNLSACALSPDGTKLAIGARDRMGMAYIYHLA